MTRKEGAQPGNKNALKHGIYSQFILLADDTSMRGMSDRSNKDDIAMARVKFAAAMKKQLETSDLKEWLSCDYACHYWLETVINAKTRALEHEQVAKTVWETFIDAIRAANDRQGVKR